MREVKANGFMPRRPQSGDQPRPGGRRRGGEEGDKGRGSGWEEKELVTTCWWRGSAAEGTADGDYVLPLPCARP